jgi:ATP-dependent Lhr-like helicase
VHQILAMALSSDGIPVEEAWVHLSRVPDFRGIHRAEFDRLIAWMLRDRSLLMASGRLVLQRRFGRRHFMELYAVFSSPQTYTVQTASGQALGSLNQGFVDRLVDGVAAFSLAGGRGRL